MILVVTHSQDLGADPVIRHLQRRGAAYLRLNTDELGTPPCRISVGADGPMLACRGRHVAAAGIASVWYRRFAPPAVLEAVAPAYRDFVARELAAALDGFLESVPGLQVNRFEADRLAGNRLLQAARARQAGFRVPETLLTQDADAARTFVLVHGAVVTKAISFGALGDPAGQVAYTSAVGLDADWTGLAVCPGLFQERVAKRREWRLTTVGARVFAARTRDGAAVDPIDWRRSEAPDTIFEPAELPAEVGRMILSLCARSDLVFATHDLIETPAGEFCFLETNPAGQWGWLELGAGLPIAAALAGVLDGRDRAWG